MILPGCLIRLNYYPWHGWKLKKSCLYLVLRGGGQALWLVWVLANHLSFLFSLDTGSLCIFIVVSKAHLVLGRCYWWGKYIFILPCSKKKMVISFFFVTILLGTCGFHHCLTCCAHNAGFSPPNRIFSIRKSHILNSWPLV